jgi:hypothetical protein
MMTKDEISCVRKLFKDIKKYAMLPGESVNSKAVKGKTDPERRIKNKIKLIAEQILAREFDIKPNMVLKINASGIESAMQVRSFDIIDIDGDPASWQFDFIGVNLRKNGDIGVNSLSASLYNEVAMSRRMLDGTWVNITRNGISCV